MLSAIGINWRTELAVQAECFLRVRDEGPGPDGLTKFGAVSQACQAISAGSGVTGWVMVASWRPSQYGLIAPRHKYLTTRRAAA
jgi:hypothetical protein